MDKKEIFIKLRKETGMNRREFCEYMDIPYRTVQDWELGNREINDYILRLLAYKLQMEKILKNHGLSQIEDEVIDPLA